MNLEPLFAVLLALFVLHSPQHARAEGVPDGAVIEVTMHPVQRGVASVYANGDGHEGSKTASGERVNPRALTAAHRSLPFGSWVEVTNVRNGRKVTVRVNDRGPFVRGRVIDLTPAGARALGFSGIAPVTLERL